jgi:hypothetical protein
VRSGPRNIRGHITRTKSVLDSRGAERDAPTSGVRVGAAFAAAAGLAASRSLGDLNVRLDADPASLGARIQAALNAAGPFRHDLDADTTGLAARVRAIVFM